MKILVIITGNWGLSPILAPNIQRLKDQMALTGYTVDYAAISMTDDFNTYDDITSFKYKEISDKKILGRLCDFITKYRDTLDYDWYMRIRPEVELSVPIDFATLNEGAMNARAREYSGPKSILYGASVGGEGMWESQGNECRYNDNETIVILDDQLILFHRTLIVNRVFEPVTDNRDENEWVHTHLWVSRGVPLNIVGIKMIFKRKEGNYAFSGHINFER